MKSIQVTIDEPLLQELDRLIAILGTTRSAFIRDALQVALRKYAVKAQEVQHAQGYARHPAAPGEFDLWAAEQVWDEE